MGGILWQYQTQVLFIICPPDTDVTENSHSGSRKKQKQKNKKKNPNKQTKF